MATERDKKAIIIGAGPAGLTAAYELLCKTEDIKPIIFEQNDCVGGISRTVFFNGNGIDIGGHRLFSKSQLILDLWEEFLPSDKNPEVEDAVMLKRPRFSEILYLRKLFNYPLKMTLETFRNMGLKNTFKAGFSYIKSCIIKRNEVTLEDFMINRFGNVLYQMFFEKYTQKVWGRHPSAISKDWGEQRIKGLSLIKAVLNAINPKKVKETTLIDEYLYPKLGCGQLWNLMAEKIVEMGGEIHYNSTVCDVKTEENKIKSIIVKQNGIENTCDADYFLSSMPVKDLIAGMNDVPDNVKNLAEGLPYRDYILVGLHLKDINLKENGKLTKDSWIYIQEDDVKVGRMEIVNNWSPYIVNDHIVVGLEYFCEEGDEDWIRPDDEFINFAISEMEKLQILKREDVISSMELRVKKAYPAYFDTFSEFNTIQEYLDKFNNLYCIGRNGQHRYNNMDHSMLTGIEAVKVIKGLSDKNVLWSINSENEYHESK